MRQVIYAWNYLEWGGAQIHLLAIMKNARKEFDVCVVMPEGSDPQFLSYLDREGIKYRTFEGHAPVKPVKGLHDRFLRRRMKVLSEYSMVRAISAFDLSNCAVHIDLLPHSSFLPLAWLASKAPVFVTSHNAMPPVSPWRKALWKLKGRAISRFRNFNVFCSNEHAKSYFRQYYSKDVADRIRVTYTSIDPYEIDKALAAPNIRGLLREKFDFAEDDFIVVCVGNFIDRKGRWTFLDAAKQISADPSLDKMRFIWLTPNLPGEADIRRVEDYGIQRRFRLVVSSEVGSERQDILQFFRIGDAFALPSFVEGLPIALLEAMALGLPSISTNVYAIPEALIDDETGILIEAGDPAALADGLIRYYRNSELRERLADAGSRHVRRNFVDWEVARIAIAEYRRAFDSAA